MLRLTFDWRFGLDLLHSRKCSPLSNIYVLLNAECIFVAKCFSWGNLFTLIIFQKLSIVYGLAQGIGGGTGGGGRMGLGPPLLTFEFCLNKFKWHSYWVIGSIAEVNRLMKKMLQNFGSIICNLAKFCNVWQNTPCPVCHSAMACRDDWIVDFYYLILSCFWKMISVSDPIPVLVEIILSVSEKYPKVYCDAQHTFLCCVYFALQNNCWSYFALNWARLVEVVTWQVWNACHA